MDANENPFQTGLNRYPDPLQRALKADCRTERRLPEQIFLGNGSDEAIDLVVRIFCEPRQDHIFHPAAYLRHVPGSRRYCGCGRRQVSLTPDFQPDVAAILAAATPASRIVFVCSPNNPTGNLADPEAIRRLASTFQGIVVVDEAYIDFSTHTGALELLPEFPNLIVMQTFSKAWGMAGIRLGMAFASKEIIHLFNKVKPPYNINQLTQEKALEALQRPEEKDRMVEILLREREKLETDFGKLPSVHRVYPSDANFLLVRVTDPHAMYTYLVEQGIIVRNRANVHLCEGSLRISIGTPKKTRR
ncbi:MAG: histidinol-phosphate transaminase [Haliscomenobacter sp.]|nr:histidinol-phosphate transaminase [Haliscomenobacter sp.]